MVWMTWMPVAPIPTTPTRLSERSRVSRGHRPVWKMRPLKVSCPAKTLSIGAESMPPQVMKNCASICSPLLVLICQRPRDSSYCARVTVVLNWMSRRRSSRSATYCSHFSISA